MRALAIERIPVFTREGRPDGASGIFAGDLCRIGTRTETGLWPVTYPTAKGEKTRWLRELKGFLVNQRGYAGVPYPARGYEKATVKSGGCGVCAAVMAVGALTGQSIPVPTMAEKAIRWGARVSGGTDMNALTRHLCAEYGLSRGWTDSTQRLLRHLEQGGVAICNTAGKGMFSGGGHYMTVFGMTEGKLCIGDPDLYKGKYAFGKRKKAVETCGELLLAPVAVLDADCVGRRPRYWLLDKKAGEQG